MGSENSPGRLRFDFPSPQAVSDSILNEVESRVNTLLLDDLPVTAEVMSQDAARSIGAMALFGEKYGDKVRVVSVGDWARELCGGTHTPSTGHLGVVKFLSEGSVGAGVRRVEALVGSDAYSFLAKEHILLAQISENLKARPEELAERIESLVNRLRDAEKELDKVRAGALRSQLTDLVTTTEVAAVTLKTVILPEGSTANDVRTIVTDLKGQFSPGVCGVVAGFAVAEGKVSVVIAATSDAIAKQVSAGNLLTSIAPVIDGRGGGKPELAQGGGTKAGALGEAVIALTSSIQAAQGK
jgi:alanyl-tRNA synthetase